MYQIVKRRLRETISTLILDVTEIDKGPNRDMGGLDQYMFSSTLDNVSNFFGLFNELLPILLKDFYYKFGRTIYNIFDILASFRKSMPKTCPLNFFSKPN
jgi:hypothetical protein